MAFFSFSRWLKNMQAHLRGTRQYKKRSPVRTFRSTRLSVDILEDRVVPTTILTGFNNFDGGAVWGPNDDGTYPAASLEVGAPTGGAPVAQALGFNINFFGDSRSTAFINNNGNITFNSALADYDPFGLTTNTAQPIIAPFFADVDSRYAGSPVSFGTGTVDGHAAFAVNYVDVDKYASAATDTVFDSFQVVIIDRADTGTGPNGDNFDFVFNYDQVLWDTGSASSNSAHAGYSNGSGTAGTFYEIAGSGTTGAFRDSGPAATSLIHNRLTTSDELLPATDGRYYFSVRNGVVTTPGNLTPPVASVGQSITNDTVYHFTGSDPNTAHYTASVNTGDTTLSSAANASNVQIVTSGSGFDVDLSYQYLDAFTNHTFAVTVTPNVGTPISASTSTFSVAKASSITTVVDAGGTYTGSAFPETSVLATGAAGLNDSNPADFTFSYVGTGATVYAASANAPVNPGTYTVTATYHGDANHTGSTSSPATPFTIAIVAAPGYYAPAGSPVEFEDPAGTYSAAGAVTPTQDPTGTYSGAGAATPTTDPAGTYSAAGAGSPTTDPAGTYSPAGAGSPITDPAGTYSATGAGSPTTDPAGTYSAAGAGSPTTDPAGTYSAAGAGSPTTNPAGTYSAAGAGSPTADPVGTYSPAGAASPTTFPAGTLGNLSQVYSGAPESATATISGLGTSSFTFTYNGSATPPTAVGSYAVVATLVNANYQGRDAGTLVIAKAGSATTVVDGGGTYTGSAFPETSVQATGAGGLSDSNPADFTFSYVGTGSTVYAASANAPVSPGTYAVTATYLGDADHTGSTSAPATPFTIAIVAGPGYYAPAGSPVEFQDPAGTYSPAGAVTPTQDPAGTYSGPGAGAPTTDPASTYSPAGAAAPTTDPAGTYSPAGAATPTADPAGTYSPAGAAAPTSFPAGTLGNLNQVYSGAPESATASISGLGTSSFTFTYNSSATPPTAAGSYAVVATLVNANYQGTVTGTLVIGQAGSTTTVIDAGGTYTGSAFPETSVQATGAGGLSDSNPADFTFSYVGTGSTVYAASANAPVSPGTYAVTATYLGDADHTGSTSAPATPFTIAIVAGPGYYAPAGSPVEFQDPAGTYSPAGAVTPTQDPAGTYSGPGAGAPTTDPAGTYSPAGAAAPTTDPAGTYSPAGAATPTADPAGTYSPAGAAAPTSFPAGTLGNLNQVYSGAPESATATISGLGTSSFTFTYNGSATPPSAAGSYAVVATLVNANYQGTVTGTLVIGQAGSTTTVIDAGGTYTGSAFPETSVLATGAGGLNDSNPADFTFSYVGTGATVYSASANAPVNPATYAVTATYLGDANHTGSTSAPATPFTIAIVAGPGYYAPAGSPVEFLDPAGTYSPAGAVTPTQDPAGTYSGPGAGAPTTDPAGTYSPAGAAAPTTDPAGTYSPAGAATPTADPAGTYSPAGAAAPTSFPAGTLGNLNQVYSGAPESATASISGLGTSSFTFTYNSSATPPTAAGSYAVVATLVNANYQGTVTGTLVIGQAGSTTTVIDAGGTYTGSAFPETSVLATGAGGLNDSNPADFTFSYVGTGSTVYAASANAPVSPGTYAVTATYLGDANHTGSTSAPATPFTIAIVAGPGYYAPAGSPVEFLDPAGTYSPAGAVTPTQDPPGTYSGPGAGAPTTDPAGTYSPAGAAAPTTDPAGTYSPAGAATPTADPAGTYSPAGAAAPTSFPAGTLGNLNQVYSGAPESATATISGLGTSSFTFTYNSSATPPTAAGSYAVVATLVNANYQGTVTGTLVIGQAGSTTTVIDAGGTYTGSAFPETSVLATGAGGLNDSNPADFTFSYVGTGSTVYAASANAPVSPGTYAVTATYLGDANHTGSTSAPATPFTIAIVAGPGYYAPAGSPVEFLDPAGTYSPAGAVTPTQDPAGTYSGPGAGAPTTDPASTYSPAGAAAPTTDPAGTYSPAGAATPTADPAGTYSPAGAAAPTSFPAGTLGNLNQVYSGAPESATATISGLGTSSFTFTYNGSATPPTAAGSYAVVATLVNANYQGTVTGTLVIGQAGSTTTVIDAGGTYTGSAFPETSVLATGAGDLSDSNPADFTFSYVGTGSTVYSASANAPVSPGTYAVTATYLGDANHTGSTSAPATPFTIAIVAGPGYYAPAGSPVEFQDPAGTYSPAGAVTPTQDPAGTYSGPGAGAPTTDPASTYSPAGAASPTTDPAGTYSPAGAATPTADPAGTYSPAGAAAPTSFPAGTLGNLNQVYSGAPESATASISGLGTSSFTFTYNSSATPPTAAGSYAVVATLVNANYQGTVTGTLVIGQAGSTTTVIDAGGTYTGSAFPETSVLATGAGGLNDSNPADFTFSYVGTGSTVYAASANAPVSPGTYAVTATYLGDADHTGSTSAPATPFTIAIVAGPGYYAPAGSPVEFQDPAGTYSPAGAVTPTQDPAGTYSGPGAGAPTTDPAGTYSPAGAAAPTTDPAGTYSPAGAATPTADPAGTYSPAGAAAPTSFPAGTLGNLNQVYSGAPESATATISGLGTSSFTFTYNGSATPPTAAGSYAVVATLVNANYQGTVTGTLVISQAGSTTTVIDAGGTYTGSAFPETSVLATGAGDLSDSNPADFTFSYVGTGATVYAASANAPVNPGTYAVTATYLGDANHTGSTSAATPFTIAIVAGPGYYAPAGSPVEFQDPAGTYSPAGAVMPTQDPPGTYSGPGAGAPTTDPAGTYSPAGAAAPTTDPAGTYSPAGAATPTADPAGTYSPAGAAAPTSFPANTLTNLNQVYSGSPESAGASISGLGATSFTFTYNGSATPPTAAGSYAVVATLVNANYQGSATGTLVIAKANAAITVTPTTFTYDTTTHTNGAFLVAGVGAGITQNVTWTYVGDQVNTGTYTATATYAGDANHLGGSASATMTISAAGATVLGNVYILNQTASGALTISGNAQLDVTGTLQVDSSSSSAVNLSGNAEVNASQTKIVGGDQVSGNAQFTHAPTTHAASAADPLAALAAATGGTSYAAVNLSGNTTQTINPGIYPSISVSGNAKLTLLPGTYIIGTGGMTVSGNATITGGTATAGVLIYNTGALNVSGNATINLTAYSTGDYAGLAIYQAQTDANAVTLSGNANLNLNGSFLYDAYAQSVVTISGNAQIEASLVVNELTISGNADDTAQ